jgi:hypothetical protein
MTRYGGPWLAYVRLEDPPGLSPITTVGRLPRFEEAPGVVLLRNCMGLAATRSTIADEVAHLAGASEREAAATRPSGVGAWWATPREPAEPTAGDCGFTPPSSVFAENE